MEVRTATAAFLGTLAVGVTIAVDPAGLSPFGPAKWLVVGTLGVLLVATSVADPVTLTRVEAAFFGTFAVLVVIATARAREGRYAWSGTPDRHFGALGWLIVGGCYLAGRRLDRDGLRTVARACSLAAAAIGGWCAWELAAGRPVELVTTTARLTGPFGSAAYLGAAAVLFGGVAGGLAAHRGEALRWRIVAGIGAAGGALALIGSGSRASWVGAAVALAVVPARRTTLAAAAAVLAVALIVLAPRAGELVERPHGAGSRLDEWVVALRVVERHPWFGVGPEGYRLAIAEGVDDHYERTYGRDVVPDRAHSAPLDVAVTLGIPAGVLWGAAAVAVIRTARRAAAADALCTGVAVAVVGYLANQTMLFPLIELDPVAWGLAGALVAATRPRPGDVPASATARGTRLPVVRRIAAVTVAAGAFAVLAGGVGTLAADRFARRSVVAAARGDRAAELRAAARAVDLDGGTVRYRLLLAGAELDSGTVAGIDRAAAAVDAALAISPGDPVVRGERARIASSRAAATGDPGDIADALSRWEDLVAGDPHRAAWQRGLALAAAEAGDALSARAALDRAAQLGDRLAPALLAELDRIEAGG